MESNPCLDIQLKPVTVLIPSTVSTDDALATIRRFEEVGIEVITEVIRPEIPWHTRELMKLVEDSDRIPVLLGGPSLHEPKAIIEEMIHYRGSLQRGAMVPSVREPEPIRFELRPRVIDTDWMTYTYVRKGGEKVGERRTPSERERARNKKKRKGSKKARKISLRSRK